MNVKSFDRPSYHAINEARLAHLASLKLPLENKTVLEVGAGIGDLTHFFEQRGCSVLSTEGRRENVVEFRRRWPLRKIEQVDLNEEGSHTRFGTFDIVFCYGTLYHVPRPLLVLQDLAHVCKGMLLLSTRVHSTDNGEPNLIERKIQVCDQGLYEVECVPARNWIFEQLRELFPCVYSTTTQPQHVNFPLEWPATTYSRAVFVASHEFLASPFLVDHLLKEQTHGT